MSQAFPDPGGLAIGVSVGNYRIEAKIGEGGMGAVYLATHPLLGRKAAVKVLLPEHSKRGDVVNRFFNEAKTAASLRHPALVEVFDFGFLPDGAGYLVMDYVEGESLTERLVRVAPLGWELAADLGRQIAQGVAAAHDQGIVHRDLKPDNIMLVTDPEDPERERVKILDFGIAKLLLPQPPGSKGATTTGMVLGTPLYMAPEQCRGAGQVDHRADIYSVGCIVYQMLTGRPPFDLEGVGEILAAHLHQPVPTLRALDPGLPQAVEAVVMRALQKDPGARQQSMAELAAELERLGGSVGSPASGRPSVSGLSGQSGGSNPSAPGFPGHAAANPSVPSFPAQRGSSQTEVLVSGAGAPGRRSELDPTGVVGAAPTEFGAPPPLRPQKRGGWRWMVAGGFLAAAAVAALLWQRPGLVGDSPASGDRPGAAQARPKRTETAEPSRWPPLGRSEQHDPAGRAALAGYEATSVSPGETAPGAATGEEVEIASTATGEEVELAGGAATGEEGDIAAGAPAGEEVEPTGGAATGEEVDIAAGAPAGDGAELAGATDPQELEGSAVVAEAETGSGRPASRTGRRRRSADGERRTAATHAYERALAHRAAGREAEAVLAFRAALAHGGLAPDERVDADRQLVALGRKFGEIEIRCDVPGVLVTIDGRTHGRTPLPHPVLLLPGRHHLRLSRPGYETVAKTVTLAAGARVPMTFTLPR